MSSDAPSIEQSGQLLSARLVLDEVRVLLAAGDDDAALDILARGVRQHPDDAKLIAIARGVAVQYGHFGLGVEYAQKLMERTPAPKNEIYLFFCLMALREFGAVETLLESPESDGAPAHVPKLKGYFNEFRKLEATFPILVDAWKASLGDYARLDSGPPLGPSEEKIPVIQYWSQGVPPNDVGLLVARWNAVLEKENLGTVLLFDRASAQAWIGANAPEFGRHFSQAFHYAMESDIFRLAYASRKSCIYIDIDSWPLSNTGSILKFMVRSGRSMLYFRSYRPTLLNGFFVARPDCPFFTQMAVECAAIDLDGAPQNRVTIDRTFGPSRYNANLKRLIKSNRGWSVAKAPGVHGCSELSFGDHAIYFSHEAAVAAVKPPFPLGYKATEDYWKVGGG